MVVGMGDNKIATINECNAAGGSFILVSEEAGRRCPTKQEIEDNVQSGYEVTVSDDYASNQTMMCQDIDYQSTGGGTNGNDIALVLFKQYNNIDASFIVSNGIHFFYDNGGYTENEWLIIPSAGTIIDGYGSITLKPEKYGVSIGAITPSISVNPAEPNASPTSVNISCKIQGGTSVNILGELNNAVTLYHANYYTQVDNPTEADQFSPDITSAMGYPYYSIEMTIGYNAPLIAGEV